MGNTSGDRRRSSRRVEDVELKVIAQDALDRATKALGKWEGHEQLCAERYKRLDGTIGKLIWLMVGTLLAVTGTFGAVLMNLALSGKGP